MQTHTMIMTAMTSSCSTANMAAAAEASATAPKADMATNKSKTEKKGEQHESELNIMMVGVRR